MSLHIYVAHSGEQVRADPAAFASLDSLRSWISQKVGVSAANQILMTTRGRQVKLQTLLTETEIFVFDRLYISPATAGRAPAVSQRALPPPLELGDPPDPVSSPADLQAWQGLFRTRRLWAEAREKACSSMAELVQSSAADVAVLDRAVGVAIANLQTHVRSLEQKYGDAQLWSSDLVKEQESTVRGWEATSPVLGRISIKSDFLRFASSRASGGRHEESAVEDLSTSEDDHTLQDFIDTEKVSQAADLSRKISQHLAKSVADLGSSVEKILAGSDKLVEAVSNSPQQSLADIKAENARLREDVELVAKKLASDTEHVSNLSTSSKSISQASRMASQHLRSHLPSLNQSSLDLDSLQRRALEKRNESARTAVGRLQTVSAIESMLASVNPQLAALEVGPEGLAAFELLGVVSRLPTVYGSLLVEAIRRREWADKIRADSSSLAEELAVYKEEEERRRKKWRRGVGGLIHTDATDGRVLGVELNLQGDERPWPSVGKDEVDVYLKTLAELPGMDGAVKEIARMARETDQPTRQQSRRAKAFRSGSIHDAAFGRGSLLLGRGNDEMVRSLRDDRSALEDRLKGSQSRVRKLEDLLHRQSQVGRASSANVFPGASTFGGGSPNMTPSTAPNHPPSPLPHALDSRRSSVSSRRVSATRTVEEKGVVQRIVTLEADLIAGRENAAGFQREVAARKEAAKELEERLQETESVKKGLMDKLESQQRDFAAERKMLEGEVERAGSRVEEVEDELDRVLGRRDQGKAGTDPRVQHLEGQLEKTRAEAETKAERLRDDAASLRLTVKEHHERAEARDRQVEVASQARVSLQDRVRDLEAQRRERDETWTALLGKLEAVHSRVAPSAPRAVDAAASVAAIEAAARAATEGYREQSGLLGAAQVELRQLQQKMKRAEADAEALSARTAAEETASEALRTAVAAAKADVSRLKDELEHAELVSTSLRADLSSVRKGSDELEKRVGDDRITSAAIRADLAHKTDQVRRLTEELWQKAAELRQEQTRSQTAKAQLSARTIRARELSERLYSQKVTLHRLLDVLGYVVTHRDGVMSVERVSRSTGASVTDADPPASLTRSSSGPMPRRREKPEERALAGWMDDSASAAAEQAKYDAFAALLRRLDMDVFTDVVSRRVKELEHLTRRWQKEARAYRERAHRFQLEAHEKIAFRSFREGDLALFLPTRNQATRPWAAFNVGAPHYFLREQDGHELRARDWLLARISRVEERVVDLSRPVNGVAHAADGRSIGGSSDGARSADDENPFELSDGLRWYLLDAGEAKPAAPSTPGLGKSTVASAHVDATGSIRLKQPRDANQATRTLSKSLDSRRGSASSHSRRGVPASPALVPAAPGLRPPSCGSPQHASNPRDSPLAAGLGVSPPAALTSTSPAATLAQEVRPHDLLLGP